LEFRSGTGRTAAPFGPGRGDIRRRRAAGAASIGAGKVSSRAGRDEVRPAHDWTPVTGTGVWARRGRTIRRGGDIVKSNPEGGEWFRCARNIRASAEN
jgi:hypothetical protein